MQCVDRVNFLWPQQQQKPRPPFSKGEGGRGREGREAGGRGARGEVSGPAARMAEPPSRAGLILPWGALNSKSENTYIGG